MGKIRDFYIYIPVISFLLIILTVLIISSVRAIPEGVLPQSKIFELENLYIAAGLVVSPSDLITSVGVVATLYVAVAFSESPGRNKYLKQKKDSIHDIVSLSSVIIAIASFISIFLYFFQRSLDAEFADFLIYIIVYIISVALAFFPRFDRGRIEKRISIKKREKETLERDVKIKSVELYSKNPPWDTGFYKNFPSFGSGWSPSVKRSRFFIRRSATSNLFALVFAVPSILIYYFYGGGLPLSLMSILLHISIVFTIFQSVKERSIRNILGKETSSLDLGPEFTLFICVIIAAILQWFPACYGLGGPLWVSVVIIIARVATYFWIRKNFLKIFKEGVSGDLFYIHTKQKQIESHDKEISRLKEIVDLL